MLAACHGLTTRDPDGLLLQRSGVSVNRRNMLQEVVMHWSRELLALTAGVR